MLPPGEELCDYPHPAGPFCPALPDGQSLRCWVHRSQTASRQAPPALLHSVARAPRDSAAGAFSTPGSGCSVDVPPRQGSSAGVFLAWGSRSFCLLPGSRRSHPHPSFPGQLPGGVLYFPGAWSILPSVSLEQRPGLSLTSPETSAPLSFLCPHPQVAAGPLSSPCPSRHGATFLSTPTPAPLVPQGTPPWWSPSHPPSRQVLFSFLEGTPGVSLGRYPARLPPPPGRKCALASCHLVVVVSSVLQGRCAVGVTAKLP